MGMLSGLRVVELAGLGPGPFAGMLLADLGAEVILVERPQAEASVTNTGKAMIVNRGKRSIAIDLKQPQGVEAVLRLVERSDALIEGMRPGVTERLGIGPEQCHARNPALVYGRITGWGQDGPLAHVAGHDINYIGLSGALFYSGEPGGAPFSPPTLIGDIGGGALYLAVGILAAVLAARSNGKGSVVDAAIVDGSAHMMNLLLSLNADNPRAFERGRTLLDGPHWYRAYRCADGQFVTIGPVEPKFYKLLMEKLGLADDPAFGAQYDPAVWPALTERLGHIFASRTAAEWLILLEGTDVCFAPVLTPAQSANHAHIAARGIYSHAHGVLQVRAAPRFVGEETPEPPAVPRVGEHSAEILREIGMATMEPIGSEQAILSDIGPLPSCVTDGLADDPQVR